MTDNTKQETWESWKHRTQPQPEKPDQEFNQDSFQRCRDQSRQEAWDRIWPDRPRNIIK